MKAVRLHEFGDAENLKIEEVDKPTPGAGEILIKVAAAGINFADISRRRGTYLSETKLPYIMGMEAAGTVEEVGADVTNVKVGDRVLALGGGGGYAEYFSAKAAGIFPIPHGLTFGEASAMLVQGLTAVGLLREAKSGQSILVHAAAGGVGTILVQLAKHRGLKVIGTASNEEKLALVTELGADAAIDYTQSNWTEKALEATDGKGVDLIIEMVGGDIVGENLKALAINGTMTVYGSVTGQDHKISVIGLMHKNHTVRGYWLSLESPKTMGAYSKELLEHVAAGRLKISVTEFPLAQAAEAHKAIETRKTTGKVVLTN